MAQASGSSGRDTTVLLVDEHAVTRVGQRAILATGDDVRVVGECGSAAEALDLAAALHPRVAVIDLFAGDAAGFGLIRDLRVRCGDTGTLVCSAALAAHTVEHLFAIGARGYLRKDEPPERLLDAVRRVAAGKRYADPDTAGDLLESLSRSRRKSRPSGNGDADGADAADAGDDLAGRVSALSGHEVEVLHLIGHTRTTEEIAAALFRSVKTIETYRSRIKSKLRLRNTIELAQVAWQFVHRVGVGTARAA